MEEENVKIDEWKRKKAKLKVIESVMSYVGFQYQKLGGEVFSDFIFAHNDPQVKDMLKFLDHLSKNNVKQDVNPNIDLLIGYADFLKELDEVRKDLVQLIKELQPSTQKETPVPNVNS